MSLNSSEKAKRQSNREILNSRTARNAVARRSKDIGSNSVRRPSRVSVLLGNAVGCSSASFSLDTPVSSAIRNNGRSCVHIGDRGGNERTTRKKSRPARRVRTPIYFPSCGQTSYQGILHHRRGPRKLSTFGGIQFRIYPNDRRIRRTDIDKHL